MAGNTEQGDRGATAVSRPPKSRAKYGKNRVMETAGGRSHSLVKITRSLVARATPDYDGFVRFAGRGGLDINVGKNSVKRAVEVMSEVVVGATARGWRVTTSGDRKRKTIVRVKGEEVPIRILEHRRQSDHRPTKDELERARASVHFIPRWDYEFAGELMLIIDVPWLTRVRTKWSDGRRQRLEQRIESFLDGLQRVARVLAERREESARQQREFELQREREEEETGRRLEERRRIDELRTQAARWREARLLREYVAEVERVVADGGQGPVPAGELCEWAEWARQCADVSAGDISTENAGLRSPPRAERFVPSVWVTTVSCQPLLDRVKI